MSFIPFEKRDLPKELQKSKNSFIRCLNNILRRHTVGHHDLNEKLQSFKDRKNDKTFLPNAPVSDPVTKFLNLTSITQNTSEQGRRYLFDSRYQMTSLFTHGGFSQIVLANDTFNLNRSVVLKILQNGFHYMGLREQIMLRHLSYHQSKGTHYCK